MKKIISIISIFLLIVTFFLTGKSFAVSLDTVKVDVNKTTVRPGEEVKLTINFGQTLGAYTFDISYDNDIFDYVSTEGGTASDTSDKVRVTFYDSTGGSNPRENMSIIFKAKSDITTSNPTELTVTGEGLANADASVNYDDIDIPIVKNITVEPEYKDYVISLKHTGEIEKGVEKKMTLSYSSSMGRYYEHARLIAEAKTPENATVKLIAIDGNTKAEEDIIQSGWGDPQGYKIGGKDVSQVLNVKALFSDYGNYTITLKLIDRDQSDAIIAQNTFEYTITEPTNNQGPTTQEPTEQQPEEKPTVEKPSTEEPTEQQVEKPTELPKTGYNLFIPISAILTSLICTGIYFNKKKKIIN